MIISFIVPLYNAESWVERSVNNLLNLSVDDYEIILINDGSIDQTEIICEKLAHKYNNVSVYNQLNRGVSAARNYGLMVARGEYIVFVDVDDLFDIKAFNEIFLSIDQWKLYDLVLFGCYFDYYYNQICFRSDLKSFSQNGEIQNWNNSFWQLYKCNALNSVWGKIFHREIIKTHNIVFNTEMCIYEDLEFVIKYLSFCSTLYNYRMSCYHYRIDEMTNKPGKRLKAINNLNAYMGYIERAFYTVSSQSNSADIQRILIDLYLILAKEKISVSSKNEIMIICKNLVVWFDKHGFNKDNRLSTFKEYKCFDIYYNCNINAILFEQQYIKIRHKIAVILKYLRKKYGH